VPVGRAVREADALSRADGTVFTNQSDCIAYAAQGPDLLLSK
jgi:hypothetical protein